MRHATVDPKLPVSAVPPVPPVFLAIVAIVRRNLESLTKCRSQNLMVKQAMQETWVRLSGDDLEVCLTTETIMKMNTSCPKL